jgi:uncharacterized protein
VSTLRQLGRGWRFPVLPKEGDLVYEEGPEKIRQSIWIILDTERGERVMRPTFGAGLRRYLMKPNTTATRALIQYDVEQALSTWEPRIALSGVRVDEGDDPSLVLVQVAYTHLRDGKPGNLVYPFYLE